MEKVINLLSDIEEKANKIIERSTVEKAALDIEFTKNIEALKNKINNDTQKELDNLQKKMDREVAAELDNLVLLNKQRLAEMDSAFKSSHDTYVEQIFQYIIS